MNERPPNQHCSGQHCMQLVIADFFAWLSDFDGFSVTAASLDIIENHQYRPEGGVAYKCGFTFLSV